MSLDNIDYHINNTDVSQKNKNYVVQGVQNVDNLKMLFVGPRVTQAFVLKDLEVSYDQIHSSHLKIDKSKRYMDLE
ncbi:unnamed protein product [Gordionus sp. m RMFG-2023]